MALILTTMIGHIPMIMGDSHNLRGYYHYNEFSFSINALSDGYITFDTKSDMGSTDYICLYIDSSCGQGWYHPPNTWTARNHSFTAGTHKIQFVGYNQGSSSGFNDAWIDNVRIHAGYSLEQGGIVRTPSQVSLVFNDCI